MATAKELILRLVQMMTKYAAEIAVDNARTGGMVWELDSTGLRTGQRHWQNAPDAMPDAAYAEVDAVLKEADEISVEVGMLIRFALCQFGKKLPVKIGYLKEFYGSGSMLEFRKSCFDGNILNVDKANVFRAVNTKALNEILKEIGYED